MSAPATTVPRTTTGTRIAWLPVALIFVIGAIVGVVGTASVIVLSPGDSNGSVVQPIANTQLTRLLGNMDAAAERGDARLFAEFRQDLVELMGAAGFAEYQALRGVVQPTFHYSDNSGGI
jgi:hypothetical protein